jgi:hypothetical protein
MEYIIGPINIYVVYKSPNRTNLASAQQQLLDYCQTQGGHVDPSVGSKGTVKTAGDVSVQLCNMYDQAFTCDSTIIAHMFDQIWCGSIDYPTQGL